MWERRLDRFESLVLLGLAGFGFWPSAISSALLIVALAARLVRNKGIGRFSANDAWLFILPFVLMLGWCMGGFGTSGWHELKLWGLWIAVIVYFRSGGNNALFQRMFIWMSSGQALTVCIALLVDMDWNTPSYSYAIRDYVDAQFHLHPTYLSALWAWAALLAMMTLKGKWLRSILTGFLILMAVVLGGKMPVLAAAFCALLLWMTNKHIHIGRRYIGGAGIALVAISLFLTPMMKERVFELQELNTDFAKNPWLSATELRIGVWHCAWKTTADHWFLGVGLGQTRSVLDACFETLGNKQFLDGEYNTHNQLLHFWLSSGIVGLLGFIIFFIFAMLQAWIPGDKTSLVFVLFFLLICLTENYLSRQTGMMLFAFFVAGLRSPKPD